MNAASVRIIPLGGISDVTKNMYVYEYYEGANLKDILIVDCGVGFPRGSELGVDLIIPDVTYLKDKTDKIRAILLTHGHEDHISALPFHYKAMGSPPVYSSKLTSHLVEQKFEETGQKLKVTQISYNKPYQFGVFNVQFIHTTHSIPDPMHVFIKTPIGNFYHGPDFKFDLTPPYGPPPDFSAITRAGDAGILCMLSDCLGSEREGSTQSESTIGATFDELISSTKGMFLMTTFSSNISRVRQCAEAAIKYNRKIVFLGRSMRQNMELSRAIGYFPVKQRFLLRENQIKSTPPKQLCVIAAGSQGQFGSALSKISEGRNKFIKIQKGDRVLFSSDPIPGNEEEVNGVIEKLYMMGADVIYPSIQEQLHTSGHGNQEELKLLMRLTRPKYLFPIGGEVRHQRQYLKLAQDCGFAESQVFTPRDGQTIVFNNSGTASYGENVDVKSLYVDSYGVGEAGNPVIRDRQTLGKEGIVVAIVPVSEGQGPTPTPQVVSKGFTFADGEDKTILQAKKLIELTLSAHKGSPISKPGLTQEIIRVLEKYFDSQMGRKPLICVEVITM